MSSSAGDPGPQPPSPSQEEVAEKVRPLVNDILERFNQEHISTTEAGMVVLALLQRLLQVMAPVPEARRAYVLLLINLVNSFMSGTMAEEPDS